MKKNLSEGRERKKEKEDAEIDKQLAAQGGQLTKEKGGVVVGLLVQ